MKTKTETKSSNRFIKILSELYKSIRIRVQFSKAELLNYTIVARQEP